MSFQSILLAVSLSLAAGVAHAETKPAETQTNTSDSAITKQVQEKIDEDPALLGGEKIHVNTKNGVVSLSGLVDTRSERSDVVAMTRSIPGVKSVNNGIDINNNS